MIDESYHVPVLCKEVLDEFSSINMAGSILDVTLGGGGHSHALLESMPGINIVGIDRDMDAIIAASERLKCFGNRFNAIHADMKDVSSLPDLRQLNIVGILADFGVSSFQLDTAKRGFSFQKDAPLDMRMNQSDAYHAGIVINEMEEDALAIIIKDYGQDRFARRIARAICKARPIDSTLVLSQIIAACYPPKMRYGRIHPATRTFQAIRIEVNQELAQINILLNTAPKLLAVSGKMIMISYHSLEDRLVKHTFKRLAKDEDYHLAYKKIICAGDDEIAQNPRSRSAKMRVLVRGV